MNKPLQNIFLIQIQSLNEFGFQNFITKLFMYRYGAENYIPEWAITEINSLKKDNTQIGLKNLLQMVEELPSHCKRKLGDYLNIENNLFAQDYLKEIIEDLIKEAIFTDENIEYKQQIYFPDKVRLNYGVEDIEGVFQEYDIYCENGTFSAISGLLWGYDKDDITKLKARIVYDYNNKNGDFKSRLQSLTEKYLDRYSSENDDDYLFYILKPIFQLIYWLLQPILLRN